MSNKRVIERYNSIGEIINALKDAIRINMTEMKEAERLSAIGNATMQKKKSAELERISSVI